MTHFLPTVNQSNKQLNDKERESGPMVMPQEGLAPSLGSHFPTEGTLQPNFERRIECRGVSILGLCIIRK